MAHDPSYFTTVLELGLDPRARRFVLHGDLGFEDEHGKNPVQHAVRALLYLDHTPGEIEFWINTPGGPSEEMYGLYDVIRRCTNTVRTIGFGLIASAGVVLLTAGDRRSVLPNAWLMSHSESADHYFDAVWTAEQRLAWQLRSERRWAELMAARTKPPGCRSQKSRVEYWHELHQGKVRELWLDAKEMVRWGIVDEVLE